MGARRVRPAVLAALAMTTVVVVVAVLAVVVAVTGGSDRTGSPSTTTGATGPTDPAGLPSVTPSVPPGPVRHVSPAGSDGGDGSEQRPWRTIQHAVEEAPLGSTVVVDDGDYAGFTLDRDVAVFGASRDGVVVGPQLPGTQEPGQDAQDPRPDNVLVTADGAELANLTVAGCRPVRYPPGGVVRGASAAIRLDGVDGVRVASVTVRDGAQRDGTYPIGCHGIFLLDSNRATVEDSEVTGSGSGVYEVGGGTGVVIRDNWIHDNDVLIRNDPAPGDDFGATGINFTLTGQRPGPVAEGNLIERNIGPSHDYGTDGSGFEIYQAANVTMRDNVLDDNEVVLETGASRRRITCSGNVFTGNTVVSSVDDPQAKGLLLRCAAGMKITDNRIGALAAPTFQLSPGDSFGSSLQGMTVSGNDITQGPRQVWIVYGDPRRLGATVDGNRYTVSGTTFATYAVGGGPNVDGNSVEQWAQETGWDAGSTVTGPTS